MFGCTERLVNFVALTIIVVFIIVLTAKDVTTALILVGFVTSLLLINPVAPSGRLDGFSGHKDIVIPADDTPVCGQTGYPADDAPVCPQTGYPGAIDFRKTTIGDTGIEYDGDELVTYQNRARNVPERVWTGVHQRKKLVDNYVREELDERENIRWWGAHEV